MEYNLENKEINMSEKILNDIDKFTLDFTNILVKYADYVIVSGYVSIILGRSRATEDVDILACKLDFANFILLFKDLLSNGFECLNTSQPKEAFEMLGSHAIRFFKGELPIPNIELKFAENNIQKNALDNKIRIVLGEGDKVFISPLELQIAYKLSLMANGSIEEISSDKDFEDAKHIYELFKSKLDIERLKYFVDLFKVIDKWELLKK